MSLSFGRLLKGQNLNLVVRAENYTAFVVHGSIAGACFEIKDAIEWIILSCGVGDAA